jgi:uncharacterized RDD family membrane protein YckC
MVQMQSNLQKASASKRLINFIVDMIFYFIICFGAGLFMAIPILASGNEAFIDSPAFDFWANIFAYAILFLYYFAFELFLGATPAKLITKTQVLARTGDKPDVSAIALRTLIRFVPFEIFSCINGDGWHDRWSKTMVVEQKR